MSDNSQPEQIGSSLNEQRADGPEPITGQECGLQAAPQALQVTRRPSPRAMVLVSSTFRPLGLGPMEEARPDTGTCQAARPRPQGAHTLGLWLQRPGPRPSQQPGLLDNSTRVSMLDTLSLFTFSGVKSR